MADKKISELTNITGSTIADTDEFVVVDTSASETKAITAAELRTAVGNGDFTVTGNLTVQGTTITVDSASAQNIVLGDNDKMTFGAGSDLQIYHDGANSYIQDAGTGALGLFGSTFVGLYETGSGDKMVIANGGSDVELYYDNAPKLATTSTGVNITGTLTSDGLTVDGTTNLQGTNPDLYFIESDTTDLNAYIANGSGNLTFYTANDAKSSFKQRFNIDHVTGSISFFEDTGTTAKLFWDASAESLGIGTSSPANPISISGTAFNPASGGYVSGGVDLQGATAGNGNYTSGIAFRMGTRQSSAIITGVQDTTSADRVGLAFFTNPDGSGVTAAEEAMRLTSNGDLLVGKTGSAFGTAGVEASATNGIWSTRSGFPPASFNRLTNDGDIAVFYKDGAPVGSIGTNGGNPYFASTSVGLKLTTEVLPVDNNGAAADGFLDLGGPSDRFNNLYLSGGVYLGGTGAANKLDDYETGTWTPDISYAYASPTYTEQLGRYTKVGNLVTVYFRVALSAGTTSGLNVKVQGFPFTALSDADVYFVSNGYWNSTAAKGTTLKFVMFQNSTEARLYEQTTTGVSTVSSATLGSTPDFLMSITYYATT